MNNYSLEETIRHSADTFSSDFHLELEVVHPVEKPESGRRGGGRGGGRLPLHQPEADGQVEVDGGLLIDIYIHIVP